MGETELKRWLYDRSPVLVQNLMASALGWQKNRWRYAHPDARRWLAFYRETADWPDEKLRDYQLGELRRTVAQAYEHVPFYRRRFDECGVRPEDIRTVGDLGKLPYLTKQEIRQAGTDLISDAWDVRDLQASPTSGSTGMPLTLYSSREAALRNFAIRWAQCRPGLTRRDRWANFTGLELVPPDRKRPPFWRMNYAARERLYSIFHMSDENLPHYLDDLARFRPAYLYGYPSALYIVAEFILRTGWEFPHAIRAVITSSEQNLPEFRQAIEQAFHTKVWDEYGQGEGAGLAFECECGRLHERPEFALMEFVPTGQKDDGCDVYELICTSFINDAWPLIRYRVGDLALVDPAARCPLGRGGRVLEAIYGRTAHFIVAGDGSRICNISVMAKKCRNLRAMQVVQEKAGEVVFRVVPQPEYDCDADEKHMIREFRKKLGGEERMKIEVQYVDHIERTARGKFLMILSKLPSGSAGGGA